MAALSMSELATTDVAQSDAFQRKQALRKPASTRNTSSESDRVGAGGRVLRVLVVDAEQDCGTRGMVLMLHRTAPPLSEWLPLGAPMSCCWIWTRRSWTGARSPNTCDPTI